MNLTLSKVRGQCYDGAANMAGSKSGAKDIGEALSQQHEQGKLENRHCFLKVLSNIRFLACQGLPLRGDGNEAESNFLQLFRLRGEDDPKVLDWLKKKTNKYTSPEIQNEILKLMALQVLREVAANLHSTPLYCLSCENETDLPSTQPVKLYDVNSCMVLGYRGFGASHHMFLLS